MKETLDKFIEDFIIFIEEDYLDPCHNFNRDLKYSAKELDEHYSSGYREFLDKYYNLFIELKESGSYPTISIIYDKELDDYLINLSKEQVEGALERKIVRQKELDEIMEKEMKLVEEGRLDEVSPATLWIIGKL